MLPNISNKITDNNLSKTQPRRIKREWPDWCKTRSKTAALKVWSGDPVGAPEIFQWVGEVKAFSKGTKIRAAFLLCLSQAYSGVFQRLQDTTD
jgi:hypothetical protein